MSDPVNVASTIFINEEKELRSGWRVLLFFIFFLIAAILINALLDAAVSISPKVRDFLSGSDDEAEAGAGVFAYYLLGQVTNIISVLAASALSARLLERRSLASVGYKWHRGWLRQFALGSLIGAASLALVVGIEAAAGAASFNVQARSGWFLIRAFLFLFFFFLAAGAVEEMLFRGFPFQALLHNNGPFVAVAVTSILFGLAHIDNTNASLFSVLNTILAGVWLAVACLMTRSLWLATALHYSWNFTMIFVFGLPVSGMKLFNQLSWLKGQAGSPVWLSGGEYGPEAGLACTIVLIVSTLAIWKSRLFAPAEEMIAATKHGPAVTKRAENPGHGDQ